MNTDYAIYYVKVGLRWLFRVSGWGIVVLMLWPAILLMWLFRTSEYDNDQFIVLFMGFLLNLAWLVVLAWIGVELEILPSWEA